jgi:hypothetical protein
VAARAIVWASTHRRREVFVAWPTVKAIYGQDMVPAYADRYLAKTAYDGQETNQPVPPNRPDNLFEPVDGDFSAHGIFDDRAHPFSMESWLDLHRDKVLYGGGLLLGCMAAMLWKR